MKYAPLQFAVIALAAILFFFSIPFFGQGCSPSESGFSAPASDDSMQNQTNRKSININLTPGVSDEEYRIKLASLKDLGVVAVRNDFTWADIEKNPGQFDWHFYDKFVTDMREANIQILGLLTTCPPWAAAVRNQLFSPPARVSEYANFVSEVVKRYRPNGRLAQEKGWIEPYGVKDWEIWNEPNLALFWPPSPNSRNYFDLLVAARTSALAADPNTKVIHGGLSPTSNGKLDAAYLEQLYSYGLKNQTEAINLHIYIGANQPSWMTETNLVPARNLMNKYNDGSKALIITEIGFPNTFPEMNEAKQADYLTKTVEELSKSLFQGFFWFNLMDLDPQKETHGLLRRNGTQKPSYRTMKNLKY